MTKHSIQKHQRLPDPVVTQPLVSKELISSESSKPTAASTPQTQPISTTTKVETKHGNFALDAVITGNPNTRKQKVPLHKSIKNFAFSIPHKIKRTPWYLRHIIFHWLWHIFSFTGLLMLYLLNAFLQKILTFPLIPSPFRQKSKASVSSFFKWVATSTRSEERTINRMNLIDLAMRNMMFKKSRAIITVGGMAIGIGAIVFLVSIGFGLQKLVLNRVASLDELMQMDVSVLPGSKEKITDASIAKISQIEHVSKVLPVISSVAKVNFNNSVSDMAVYGVTSDYLEQSAIKPTSGKVFDSNEIASLIQNGSVAGVSTDEDLSTSATNAQKYYVEIYEGEWLKVRSRPSRSATVLGYTRRQETKIEGTIVQGEFYPEKSSSASGKLSSPWISATFPLWSSPQHDDKALDEEGRQKTVEGFIAHIAVATTPVSTESLDVQDFITIGSVLGINDETSSASSRLELVLSQLASESAALSTQKTVKVDLPQKAKKEAVVNTAMLKVLGMSEETAVGQTFSTSFIVIGDLLNKPEEKIESNPSEYTIVGIIPDEKTPFFYIPFVDLRSLGVENYSQLKIVVDNKQELSEARKKVEAIGFSTQSVADTVTQIERLFNTIRTVLIIIGMVALSVAALGMFNTLTVSLLERTREVGLMKAMGMKSHEVQELFLTESMVMGFFGGVLGIAMGTLAGEMLGFIISIFSISKGVGYVDVSYLPPTFLLFIFLLSLMVGIFTGIYPSRRATKISALNALRYE